MVDIFNVIVAIELLSAIILLVILVCSINKVYFMLKQIDESNENLADALDTINTIISNTKF